MIGAKTPEEHIKRHFYCFSYIGANIESGGSCNASVYVSYESKGITRTMIDDNKEVAKVKTNAVLLACSYLGEMTTVEFKGEES